MEFRIRGDLDAPEEASANVERPEEQDAELEHPHARGHDVELLRDEAGGLASTDQPKSREWGMGGWIGSKTPDGAVISFPSLYKTEADDGFDDAPTS
jgi:hypothetical protein